MCYFPDIQYVDNFVQLQDGPVNELPPSPRGMFTLLLNKGIVKEDFLGDIHNMSELEEHIFRLIDDYPENGVSSERIFHLIEIWGGRTGRQFYLKQPFNWLDIEPIYIELINHFTAVDTIDNQTLVDASNFVSVFHGALHDIGYKGMAVAFITKHTRFWMHRNMPNNMLPIYDKTFAVNVMRNQTANCRDLLPYWQGMVDKANREHVSLTSLERQLFRYFNED